MEKLEGTLFDGAGPGGKVINHGQIRKIEDGGGAGVLSGGKSVVLKTWWESPPFKTVPQE